MEVEWTLGFAIAEIVPTIFSDYMPYTPPSPTQLDDGEYTVSSTTTDADATTTDADSDTAVLNDIEHTIDIPVVYLDEEEMKEKEEEEAVDSTEQEPQQEVEDNLPSSSVPKLDEFDESTVNIHLAGETLTIINSHRTSQVPQDPDLNPKSAALNPKKTAPKRSLLVDILTSIIMAPVLLFTAIYNVLTLPYRLLLTKR